MDKFPQHIIFLSDDTEVELIQEEKGGKSKDRQALYKYIKAAEKQNAEVTLSLNQIEALYSSSLIKVR